MVTLYCYRGRQLLLGAGLLVGFAFGAAAQVVPDTTRLRFGEEVAAPPVANAPLRIQEEQRSLWKLGLNNFSPYADVFGDGTHYTRYGLHLAYERKLRAPAWSVLAEVSPALTHYRPDASAQTRRRLAVRAQVAGRYYYNRERRLLQGKKVGNFSANYISVALGAGLGRDAHETPNFLYRNSERQFLTPEAAVLYGLQRRLGRRGFVDANVGVAALLVGEPVVTLAASLRLGLALGPQPAPYAQRLAPASEVVTLRPRFYVGAEIGGTFYRVGYSRQTPYPASFVANTPPDRQTTGYPTSYGDGYGVYPQYLSAGPLPYLYAGYYLGPRVAVQLGFQYGESFNNTRAYTLFDTPAAIFFVRNHTLEERALAVPVLVRYALTPSFLRRVQFDAVGGLVPVWSSVTFREYTIVNHQATSEEAFGFQRRAFGLHAALGADVSYAFGRRRRVQAVAELLLNKDVRTIFQKGRDGFATDNAYANSGSLLAGGCTFGVRYRFGYR